MLLASTVAKRVQIQDVYVIRSESRRLLPIHQGVPESACLLYGCRADYELVAGAHELDVAVSLFVSAKADDSASGVDVFRIESVFHLRYTLSGDEVPNESQLEAFAKLNGIYNVWPYWREYVQSSSARMGLPPVVLPVLTVEAIQKMAQEKPKEPAPTEDSPVNASAQGG